MLTLTLVNSLQELQVENEAEVKAILMLKSLMNTPSPPNIKRNHSWHPPPHLNSSFSFLLQSRSLAVVLIMLEPILDENVSWRAEYSNRNHRQWIHKHRQKFLVT